MTKPFLAAGISDQCRTDRVRISFANNVAPSGLLT
jgi:hypothetical protein